MKNKIIIASLALLALSSVTSIQAAPTSPRIGGEIRLDYVKADVDANGDSVTPGTSRVMVSARLGTPSYVLPDGSWLYTGFAATPGGSTGTLVVRFTANKVSGLSLADGTTVTALRQMPRRPATGSLLAVR